MPYHKTYIAGMKFRPRETRDAFETLPVGAQLHLERDPENRYDPNAVKIVFGPGLNLQAGFVPADLSAEISRLMVDHRIEGVTLAGGKNIEIHYSEDSDGDQTKATEG